jgi:putative membrane protein
VTCLKSNLSKLALGRSEAPTKKFAQQMITDHEKTAADIKNLVASGKVQAPLPTAMTRAQTEMLDKLKALNGKAFTAQYRCAQVSAHKVAVDLFGPRSISSLTRLLPFSRFARGPFDRWPG